MFYAATHEDRCVEILYNRLIFMSCGDNLLYF